MVPPEFTNGDIGTAGEIQQLTAARGDDNTTPGLTISTTTTADDPGHDNGPHVNRINDVASPAITKGTSADMTGTLPVYHTTDPAASAAAPASTAATISTTPGPQWVYHVNNAGNNGRGTIVPRDVAGDDAGTAGDTQQYAPAGDNDVNIDSTALTSATSGRPGHDNGTHAYGTVDMTPTVATMSPSADMAGPFLKSWMSELLNTLKSR